MVYRVKGMLAAICLLTCIGAADQWSSTDIQNMIASGGSSLTGISELSKQLRMTETSFTKNINSRVMISDSSNLQVGLSSISANCDENGHKFIKTLNFLQTLNLPKKSTILVNQHFVFNWDKSKIDSPNAQLDSIMIFPLQGTSDRTLEPNPEKPEGDQSPKTLESNSEKPEGDQSPKTLESNSEKPEGDQSLKALKFNSENPEDFYKQIIEELGGFQGSDLAVGTYMNWQNSESSDGITCVWGHKISVVG
jgi:hypothetical protein